MSAGRFSNMNREEYEKTYRTEKSFWWFVAKRRLVEALAERALGGRGGRILDLGCGTGANLEALGRRGEAFGVDLAAEALECSSRRGLTALAAGNARRLPFREESFDLVTALDLLEHLEDDAAVLAEAFRVLRPGGWFLATTPAYPWLWGAHDLALGHQRRYRRSELGARLKQAGFLPGRLSYFFGMLFPALLPVRLWQKRWGNPEETVSYEPWPPLNRALLAACLIELKLNSWISLPFGTTLVALAQKPPPP